MNIEGLKALAVLIRLVQQECSSVSTTEELVKIINSKYHTTYTVDDVEEVFMLDREEEEKLIMLERMYKNNRL